ncbi:hypothetical protein EIP91_005962 [Steccherinum ochraceum]|uniref:PABS domain-containing protein n=1 Tax=Steccherinum ochraceum TaxID=92696 RepID=A0A4R0RTT9_9APHY|nr:hypothetical protein EIP91_005962 [Steccherinum ochraceum]
MNTAQPEPTRSPLASAIANAFCLVILVGTSLSTFGYLRALEPLYGPAAASYNLNKVVWAACIFGSLAPTIPVWPAVFGGGLLVAAMPLSAYWVAVYTGRMGDVIWGPVVTHLVVIAPVLYLASALVKALQETPSAPDQTGVSNAAASMIGLPVCRMAIMSLQDIWPLIPYLKNIDENVLLQTLGSAAVTIWVISPFLIPAPEQAVVPAKEAEPVSPGKPKSKKKGKGGNDEKKIENLATSPPTKSTPQKPAQSAFSKHSWRTMILPSIPLLINFGLPPTLVKPLTQPWDHPSAPLRVLSSVRTPYSGVVVVGDILPPRTPEEASNLTYPTSLRYMRAGHSLLGGTWIGDKAIARDRNGHVAIDESGTPLGDSIYSTFVLQEAARLVALPDERAPKTALTIGLGTGIVASAFIKHGLSTTIVELDPAVHEAARRFFGLATPEPGKLVLSDARAWVNKKRRALEGADVTGVGAGEANSQGLFDIVVHDCFSGGGVPGHMFTVGFWEDLKAVMHPTGVVAVNFAGKLGSDSSRAIVLTLNKVFGRCRAFHDSMETLSQNQLNNDFINWVFFCTPSTDPINFRPPVEADLLNSYLRDRVLTTLPEREIDLNRITGHVAESDLEKYILTDMRNPLVDWQRTDALHHWKVMREVLPDVFWEAY